jgi:hypothetical protein
MNEVKIMNSLIVTPCNGVTASTTSLVTRPRPSRLRYRLHSTSRLPTVSPTTTTFTVFNIGIPFANQGIQSRHEGSGSTDLTYELLDNTIIKQKYKYYQKSHLVTGFNNAMHNAFCICKDTDYESSSNIQRECRVLWEELESLSGVIDRVNESVEWETSETSETD